MNEEPSSVDTETIDTRLRDSAFGRTIEVTGKPKMIEPMPKVLTEDCSEQCASD